jgi:hypothetical protein
LVKIAEKLGCNVEEFPDIIDLDNVWMLDVIGAQKQESDQIEKDREEFEEEKTNKKYNQSSFKQLKH